MKNPRRNNSRLALALVAVLATGLLPAAIPAVAQETAVALEKNPPGDIPDSQAFVTYVSPLGFSLKVPEGWARKETPAGASFADKYGAVEIQIADAPAPPTIASATNGEVAELQKNGRAVKVASVQMETLASGPAVQIVYTSNSGPNSVTGKQIRQENERYLIGHNSKRAVLTFSAPQGADNADQWKLMRDSLRWQ